MNEIFRSPLFVFGLAVKVVCLFFFASSFPQELFIPFFDASVQNLSANPWTLSPPHFFPYGGFLYVALVIPKAILYFLFGDAALGVTPLSLMALKLPLLFFDIVFLGVLKTFAGERWRSLLTLYWLNPVLFYITYVHVQLDIVSMSLVLIGILFLLEKNIYASAIAMALATASKFHVVVAIPILIVFIWNRHFRADALKRIGSWLGLWGLISLIGFLPVITANYAGHATLGSPELQRLLAAKLILSETTTIYFGVILTLVILGRIVISTKITELGLIFGAGAVFTGLVLSSHAATGWFVWCVPFFALFYSLYLNVPRILFWLFNLMYVLVFAILELFPQFTPPDIINNLLYTALQTSLLANLVALWVVALKQESPVLKRASPIRIGLAGDSGSGKNTLTENLRDIFGEKNLSVIEGDNYHKWERGDEQWEKYTHLNPKANHLFALSNHFMHISRGRPVFQNHYSHKTGKFTAPVELKPSKTLVVQGLHTFYLRSMRDLFDIKIFLAPHPLIRKSWKVQRDCIQRGYDKTKVLSQLETREKDSQIFIDTQQNYADLIISSSPVGDFTNEDAENGKAPQISTTYTTWNDVDLSIIAQHLDKEKIQTQVTIDPKQIDRVMLTVASEPSAQLLQKMASELFPSLRTLTRGYKKPEFSDGYAGLTQIIVLWFLSTQLKETAQ